MRKIVYRPIILTIILMLGTIAVLQVSYGYFDILSTSDSSKLYIGDWLGKVPPPEFIKDYIDEHFPEDTEYILDTIGLYDGETFIPDPTFENYSMGELIEIVDLINEFKNSFLQGGTNETLKFPTSFDDKPSLKNIEGVNDFFPGDVQFLKQTFMLANYADDGSNTPVIFQVAIDLPESNISDFYAEILIDNTPLSINKPFAYDSNIKDILNNLSIGGASQNQNNANLVDMANNISYTTINDFNNTRFIHTFSKPTSQGNWTRFFRGNELKIGSNGALVSVSTQNQGMKIIGTPTGSQAIVTFSIRHRTPRVTGSLPIIPVIVVISRGKLVDASGNELPQDQISVKPNLSFRVVAGSAGAN